jgi:para-aminobenzoate synthetase component 1
VRARAAVECIDLTREAGRLSAGGFWVVVGEFEGPVRAWRFADVELDADATSSAQTPIGDRPGMPPAVTGSGWHGPAGAAWTSSLDESAYLAGVESIREHVRLGDVYQVNLCRVMSAPLGERDGAEPSARELGRHLDVGNPAPYAGGVHVPVASATDPVWVVTSSPELFLRVQDGIVTSGPIKGTATTAEGLTAKDRAENVMIADMVRNDLQRVCRPGTVEVTELLAVEHHPGLVHLVTTVQGQLLDARPDWPALLEATYPPASVSGAPKHAAVGVIGRLEPVPRGPYCGAVGWIDADHGRAEIAVGIRTFWWTPDGGGTLRFGTGAGITWGSDPAAEWAETQLKAHRLVALASGPA